MKKERKKVTIKAVSGVHGLYHYKGKHGKIYFSKIEKEDKTYKKSHGWGISLTIAKENHHKYVADVNSGKFDDRKKKILFEKFVEKYLDYQKHHKRSWTRDVTSTNALLKLFKGKHLSDVHALMIERYKKERIEGKILIRKKVTHASVNRELACLKRMYRLAEDWGCITVNPVKKVKLFTEPLKDVKPLTDEQEIMLLNEWRKIPEAKHAVQIFEVALYSGMRFNEVARLEKDTIDLNGAFPNIYIHRTKSGKPKTIELNETLTGLLKTAIRNSPKDSKYVFVNPKTGKPYTSIKKTLNKALKKVGLDSFTFHHTRHTFCSRLVEAGVPEATIMELGGWSTRSMINRYAHPSPKHKLEAMKTLDSNRTKNRTTFSEGVIGENGKALNAGKLKTI